MSERQSFGQAVQTLYGATEREQRQRAEDWLTAWRKEPSAWSTADAVLYDANSSEEERYMAAHTLCSKVCSQKGAPAHGQDTVYNCLLQGHRHSKVHVSHTIVPRSRHAFLRNMNTSTWICHPARLPAPTAAVCLPLQSIVALHAVIKCATCTHADAARL